MVLTEEQAKSKRCQESFTARHTTDDGGNIYSPDPVVENQFNMTCAAPRFCLGSACMAWRWRGWSRLPDDPYGYFVEEPADSPYYRRYGFCGKAGRP